MNLVSGLVTESSQTEAQLGRLDGLIKKAYLGG